MKSGQVAPFVHRVAATSVNLAPLQVVQTLQIEFYVPITVNLAIPRAGV